MEDKFGYNEMKNVVDHDAMEEQKKQEQMRLEQEQYERERANADQVQYEYERAEAVKERDNTLNDLRSKYDEPINEVRGAYNESAILNSLQDKSYLEYQQQEASRLEKEKNQAIDNLNNRNIDFIQELHMQFELIRNQHTQIVEKEVEPTLVDSIKEKAKQALPYIAAGAIAISTIAAGINAFTQPEPVQQDNFRPNSIEDVIEHRDQQIENGITTHPEHVINDYNGNNDNVEVKSNENESSSLSNSMQEFIENENREKVIKIESGFTINPEHVIDDSQSKGGKGL